MLAGLGTTISPYPFSWQAPQEVEEVMKNKEKSLSNLRCRKIRNNSPESASIPTSTCLFEHCGIFLHLEGRHHIMPAARGLLPTSPPMEKFSCLADGRVFCIGLRAIRQQLQEIIFRVP